MPRPPFSAKLERLGWPLLPVSVFAIIGLIYQQTVLVCENGPWPSGLIVQMRPIWMAVGLALFVWMLLAVWFFAVLIYLPLKRPVKNPRQIFLICSAALVLAPGLVGGSNWRRLVLHTCGPGKHGIGFMSASARAGDISSVEFLFNRGIVVTSWTSRVEYSGIHHSLFSAGFFGQ